MEIRVEPIGMAIRVYQDFWRMYSIQHAVTAAKYGQKLYTACGAHLNYAQFGKFLLGLPHTLANNGLANFAPPPDFPNASAHGYNLFLPSMLTPWVVNGRHTYGLTEETQAVLSRTSIGNMRWCDYLPPFESYSIQLPRPISVPGGGSFDHLLVYCRQSGDETRFKVWTFSSALKNYRGIDEQTQADLTRWFNQKNFDRLKGRINRLGAHLQECVKGSIRTDYLTSSDELIGAWLEELGDPGSKTNRHRFIDNDALSAVTIACRIAIGVGLHLQSSSDKCERRPRRQQSLATRTVEIQPLLDTTEDRIPILRLRSPLNHRERVYFGLCRECPERDEIMRQIQCYWVRAHKRHRPGEPAELEKQVKVKAYVMLADRFPDFGLPPGTYTVVA